MVKLTVDLHPGAKRKLIEYDRENKVLQVWINARPINNAANKELISLLSKKFKVPKSSITIQIGEKSRRKVLYIEGIDSVEDFFV